MRESSVFLKAKIVKELTPREKDGETGEITDLYFDDETWTVRYFVIRTGSWLSGREVLVSPMAVDDLNLTVKTITFNLTKEQIKSSPAVETDQPVSRKYEQNYSAHYNWPMYWGGTARWGFWPAPYALASQGVEHLEREPPKEQHPDESHLRSINEVTGYSIRASDGEIGVVSDFLIDTESWAIRFFEIATRKWLPGKHVLLSPHWVDTIEWAVRDVSVNVPRAAIQEAPAYDPAVPVTKAEEDALFRYYKRQDKDEIRLSYNKG